MSERLTEWFDGAVKPALPGVYQCRGMMIRYVDTYQYWDGKRWGYWSNTPRGAFKDRRLLSARQQPEWRGLAEDPSAAKGGDA